MMYHKTYIKERNKLKPIYIIEPEKYEEDKKVLMFLNEQKSKQLVNENGLI